MTPDRIAALRILTLFAAYRERYGDAAARALVAELSRRNVPGLAQSGGARICVVELCENRAYGLNLYCPLHRRRFQRHGDPTVALKRGRKPTRGRS